MYSDSDVEGYDEYDLKTSSEEQNASEELEHEIELRDFAVSASFQSYAWTFEAEEGFFQTSFASYYSDPNGRKDVWNTSASPDCMQAVTVLLNRAAGLGADTPAVTATAEGGEVSQPAGRKADDAAVKPTEAALGRAAGLQPSGQYVLSPDEGRPSPASRFLCDNFSSCILIPIDKALNRAALREMHKDTFATAAGVGEDGLDVVPGYNHIDPSGWALPLSTDPATLAKLTELYPGWRKPTPADVVLFTKPESGNRTGVRGTAGSQQPSHKAWTRNAAKLMSSKERLLDCVKRAGGWAEVMFVAIDVEAFTVAAHSVPLPAEFAFVTANPPRSRRRSPSDSDTQLEGGSHDEPAIAATDAKVPKGNKEVHFFCHPGHVSAEEEVTTLFNCLTTHLIPYRSATFLAHDYRSKMRQVDFRFIRNPRVVLINKGSSESPTLMDLQAIRWLYAAAMWQEHGYGDVASLEPGDAGTGMWIPNAEDISCFDVSVLEAVAADVGALSEGEDNQRRRKSTRSQRRRSKESSKVVPSMCCWYHTVVEESKLVEKGVHCALQDARMLAKRIHAALEIWIPESVA